MICSGQILGRVIGGPLREQLSDSEKEHGGKTFIIGLVYASGDSGASTQIEPV